MNYEIKIMDIEPILAATLRFNGKHKEAGKHFPDIYKALKGQSSGPPFFCYYDKEYKETADIELCVPVSETLLLWEFRLSSHFLGKTV